MKTLPKVLVVDCDVVNTAHFAEVLLRGIANVLIAASSKEAWQCIQQHSDLWAVFIEICPNEGQSEADALEEAKWMARSLVPKVRHVVAASINPEYNVALRQIGCSTCPKGSGELISDRVKKLLGHKLAQLPELSALLEQSSDDSTS